MSRPYALKSCPLELSAMLGDRSSYKGFTSLGPTRRSVIDNTRPACKCPLMIKVNTSPTFTVWLGLRILSRFTRTLPSAISLLAMLRDFVRRACHNHLSRRCAWFCKPSTAMRSALIRCALLQPFLQLQQRGEWGIGVRRILRRGGNHPHLLRFFALLPLCIAVWLEI